MSYPHRKSNSICWVNFRCAFTHLMGQYCMRVNNIAPKPPPKTRHRKIDKAVLKRHIQEYPDMFLRERAAIFSVHLSSMGRALSKMKISKKNSVAI